MANMKKFWGFVADKLKSYAKDEESAAKTTAKMATFAAGTGTVLFFEDQNVVKGLQEQFHLMPRISQSGQNIQLLLLSSLPGQRCILKAWVHLYNTIIRL